MFPSLLIVLGIVILNLYGSVFFTGIPVICCDCSVIVGLAVLIGGVA